MGLTLVDKLNRIFNTTSNFDISGFCDPELVTEELAAELQKAYVHPSEWFGLARAGYDVMVFDAAGSSGIIGLWKNRRRNNQEHLKLYWDQIFPAEIAEHNRMIQLIKGENNEQSEQL